jgi:[ribosomal protein S5]-alanine N-acetyltransferase
VTIAFETERLIARDWNIERDVEAAFAMYGDPEVMRFLGSSPQVVPNLEEQRTRLATLIQRYAERKDGVGAWALEEKNTGEVIGTLLVKYLPDAEGNPTSDLEIGWHLRRSAWGKGYAMEAGIAGARYAFEVVGAPVLYAVIYKENVRSIAVAQRIGMIRRGPTDKYYGVTVELFELRPTYEGSQVS